MNRATALILGWSLMGATFAQNEEDALRIATTGIGGTARSNGMGNAFGALGADPASIGINPAGFGLYRSSSLSLSPSLEVNNANDTYYGTNTGATHTRFYFSSLALIMNTPTDEGSAWRSGTFGVVYDRSQSYYWSSEARADRVPSTILQGFADEAEGTSYTTIADDLPFTAGLAWSAWLIDTLPGSATSYEPRQFGPETRQRHTIERRGATNRTAFFYSGNYKDKLYLGFSLGITGHRFQRKTTHTEYNLDNTRDLAEVEYDEDLATSGNGFDVKVGALVRITERFRAGAAFHSPQWMQLNDAYVMELRSTFRTPDNNGSYVDTYPSPDGTFAYKLTTPWRATASMAYIAGTNGLVSVDYEYADMRNMRFNAANDLEDLYDFEVENDMIKQRFRTVHSVRVGTEWRAGAWYYRAGWGIVPDAYKTNDVLHGGALKTYAAGMGYRGEHITVDLGLTYSMQRMAYFQYAPYLVEPTTEERTSVRSILTVSFRP